MLWRRLEPVLAGKADQDPTRWRPTVRRARERLLIVAAALVALATTAVPASAARLPVLRIEAARTIPDEPKVRAQLRMPGYRGRIGIEHRGQSSQAFPKRSYAVQLRSRAALLGMPADDDWVLYAAYNDKTLMRNVVAYATARAIGRYAARTRFVELRLNGRYQGVYVLIERLELGAERVAGEALYEFTFPFQAASKDPSFLTPVLRRPIVWEDPERGDLTARRARALARPVKALERALYGPGRWRRRLDIASAVDFVLLNELFKNQDAFHASTYMALGSGGRLRLGPIWDFDISMGNSDYGPSRFLRGWMLSRRDWAERLYRDRAFRAAMARRWRELRAQGLRRHVLAAVESSRLELRAAAGRNFRRWPVLHRRIWPNPVARGSFRAEVRFLRGWLGRRITWLDSRLG
jgi:hypothetical protein